MPKQFDLTINKFYGGIARDEKSKIIGAAANVEEIDIWSSANYFQAEQIFSADSLPASSTPYAHAIGDDDTHYWYTSSTSGAVRLLSVATGGADNPGSASTLFTSADTTNDASQVSDFVFFRSGEASNATSLYYIAGTSTTWYLRRYNIGAAAEQIWNGSAWAAGTSDANSDLTGLNGSFMRPTMKVIFGDLYICHGQFIAKVAGGTDTGATFTEKAFTLPQDWEAVDIEAVGDAVIILCRNKARATNKTVGFWWDLTKTRAFEDYFAIPMGGPCWIKNVREVITMFCAINGVGRFYRMSAAAKGAVPLLIPGIRLTNLRADASTEPISSPKMVDSKDDVVYFGLNKTDKTGIYAIGQLDSDKPIAVILSKRFHTTDYANHKPIALKIQGPNFYADYDDNGTIGSVRCESNNSPTRSSNARYDTIWMDVNEPFKMKDFLEVQISTQPLPASTDVDVYVAHDYGSSFNEITEADATSLGGTSSTIGRFRNTRGANKKTLQVSVRLTSSTTNSPKITDIGVSGILKTEKASK